MSKNFNLMQQLEASQGINPDRTAGQVSPALNGHGRVNRHIEWAGEKALRLVQQIFLVPTQEPPRMVVFSGIDHGNGCSTTCGAVAEVLAKNSRRSVCLIEANFRSPALSTLFGTKNHHGLTDALSHAGPIRAFAEPIGHDNIWLLSSGPLAADSPSLLSPERLKSRLAELRREFDFVIIDAPPMTRYADAIAVGQLSDGIVLVIEAESTRRHAALIAVENLRSSNIQILGAVLNKRKFPIPEKIYRRL